MKEIYYLNINEISNADISFIRLNYPKRFEKSLCYRNHDDFLRCVGGYVLLYNHLGYFDESDVHYIGGKPYIKGKPFFNLSHSGELVFLVISDNEVGIDVEKIDEKNLRAIKGISSGFETKFIEEDPLERFHIVWTRKESILKCTGEGVSSLNKLKELKVFKIENGQELEYNKLAIKIESFVANGYVYSVAEKIK